MQTSDTEKYLDDDFARWIDSVLSKAHQPGVSIAVIKDGQIESSGYGFAQLPDVPATPDTLWPMASTTKAFTTTLLGILLEEQSASDLAEGSVTSSPLPITWKTPVSQILPEFITTDEYVTRYATIEDIASHRSGIAGHDLVWGPVMGSPLSISTRCLRHFEAIEGKFRSIWQYNNLLYAVLGDIIEKISGNTFETLLREKILEPLDMKSTYYRLSQVTQQVQNGTVTKSKVGRGYFYLDRDEGDAAAEGVHVPDQYSDLTGVEPAGCLVSSVNDYAKWVLALLKTANTKVSDKDTSKEKLFISRDLWQELTTPRMHITSRPPESTITPARPSSHATPHSYCLGWFIDPHVYPREIMIQHSGGLPGISSSVAMLPDRDIGIVVVGNGGMTSSICEAVTKELFGRRLGLPKEERRTAVLEDQKKEEEEVSTEAPLQEVPPAEVNTEAEPDVPSRSGAETTEIDVAQLEGYYVHQAYGTFHFVAAPSSMALSEKAPHFDGAKIIREKDPKDQRIDSEKAEEDQRSSDHDKLLLGIPIGVRGLNSLLVLHPSPTQPYPDKRLYDLETLWSHGDISKETAQGLKPTAYSDNEKVVVWQSVGVKQAAAVFELVNGANEGEPKVERLGLRVMRVDGPADKAKAGKLKLPLEQGWEKRMIWMTQMHNGD